MIPRYKDIMELIKKGSTMEAQEQIMELREAALELQEENESLRKQIKELEKELHLQKNLVWEKPYYWLEDEESKDGPFCQLCYDKEHQLIRLQGGKAGRWYCHSCTSTFYDSSYKPQKPKTRPPDGNSWLIR